MSICTAVLLAGGSSKRLGFNKILTPMCGQAPLLYSYQALEQSPEIADIVIVTHPDYENDIKQMIQMRNPGKSVVFAYSGAERFDSVWSGLQKVSEKSDFVLIHDGARPLLTPEVVKKSVDAAKKSGAIVCAVKASDTLKKVEGVTIKENIDRSQIWQMQTPQVFKRDLIIKAYKKVIDEKSFITDDAQAVEAVGGTVEVVDTGSFNRKVTTPADWEVISAYLGKRQGGKLRNAVHELNNALSPLTGYLPMLEKYIDQPEKLKEYIDKMKSATPHIQKSTRELQEIVNNIFPKV